MLKVGAQDRWIRLTRVERQRCITVFDHPEDGQKFVAQLTVLICDLSQFVLHLYKTIIADLDRLDYSRDVFSRSVLVV